MFEILFILESTKRSVLDKPVYWRQLLIAPCLGTDLKHIHTYTWLLPHLTEACPTLIFCPDGNPRYLNLQLRECLIE